MKKNLTPTLLADFYKISHMEQYPVETTEVYSTWTPRNSLKKDINKVVAFGFQSFVQEYLIDYFNDNFFCKDEKDVVKEYQRVIKFTLGKESVDATHISELHALGYLPIKICALPEGTLVPLRVPMLTIENTHSKFFWVTNFLETLMSCQLWLPSTSATISHEYKKILEKYAIDTTGTADGVAFQGHDFSMRGMGSLGSAMLSGAGHLLSFSGTDTIPAIHYLEQYYGANIETELVGTSIPATEHSVMCAYGDGNEFEAYRHLITKVYPDGFVSIVSDTWDLWKVISDIVKPLKSDIMKRDGRIVIRPDSGNPADIICGTVQIENLNNNKYINSLEDCVDYMKESITEDLRDSTAHGECGSDEESAYFRYDDKTYKIVISFLWNRYDKQYYFIDESEVVSCEEVTLSLSQKGVVELLWDIFGGTTTEQGYKLLDSHIGCIYGDAITLERCENICSRLKEKGFASTNMVFGIGSFTYQYNTRDTFGFALKSTYAKVKGVERMLFKNPITDSGIKKSQKGRVVVWRNELGDIEFIDGINKAQQLELESKNMLNPIFIDGQVYNFQSLKEIRDVLNSNN